MIEYIKNEFKDSIRLKEAVLQDSRLLALIAQAAEASIECYRRGGKILSCGNGGSASDAMHFVGELVGRYRLERDGIEAVCLNANAVNMTAIANDYDYASVFSKQVIAIGRETDVLFGISTSGNSININKAFEAAKKKKIKTIGLLGHSGGAAVDLCDIPIVVPCDTTSHIQETHILIIHIIAGLIEKAFFGARP